MSYLIDALAAIAMAIAGPVDGVPDALPQSCRTVGAYIAREDIDLDVCDCSPIPMCDEAHEGEIIVAHRLYAKPTGRLVVAGRVHADSHGQLVACIWDRDGHRSCAGIQAQEVLRALIHDDVRDLLDLLP